MRAQIALSVVLTVAVVCAAAFLFLAGEALLPRVVLDSLQFGSQWPYFIGAPVALANVSALIVLWGRRRSMLDLWLIVVICLYLIEVPLSYYPDPERFSVGWYTVRIFGVLSSCIVLIVLLYEIETLYARLLGAVLAQRREREARLMTGDAVAASIAHEVKQPLTAMVTSADAGFRFLDRPAPNLDRAKEAFKLIAADGHRAGEVVENIRANFRNDERTRTSLDVNELIREALALERSDLERHRIQVKAEANGELPEVRGNRVQLQQVLLNLITNAIDAMAVKEGPRVLSVKSEPHEVDSVKVSVVDTGTGISSQRNRPDIRPPLHDQTQRHGDGAVDLPRDHRGSRRSIVGNSEHSPRRRISIYLACPKAGVRRRLIRRTQSLRSRRAVSLNARAGSGSSVSRACRPFLPAQQAIRPPSSS